MLRLEAGMFVKRVASKENLADDPSRERYALLRRMREQGNTVLAVPPRLDPVFEDAQAWKSLSTTAHAQLKGLAKVIHID